MEFSQGRNILENWCRLDITVPVVAGVSGGPDSLCMLDMIIQSGFKVIVGHLNHQLRPEACLEAEIVAKFCAARSIPCIVSEKDVATIAGESHLSVEEAGRKLRYEFLFDLAGKEKAQAVLVAHNADDQVETILMHLLRGSGLAGLKGMEQRQETNEWSDSIPLVRPLLRIPRKEILEYCSERGLAPVIDKSNEDTLYHRNRIRNELIPFLTTYNPQVKERLIKMADVVQVEDGFLQQAVTNAIESAVTEKNDHYILFSLDETAGLHPAILRRMVLSTIRHLKPVTPNISHEIISRGAEFLMLKRPGERIDLVADLELFKYLKKYAVLCDRSDPLDDLWPQINDVRSMDGLDKKGWNLNGRWKLIPLADDEINRTDPWRCCLDSELLNDLNLDTFKPGDKFSPCGMNGKSLKLGDYWTNEGLPVRARANWPLIRSGGEIVWVPGFRISEKYKVTESTRKIISLLLTKED
jgi:tRNA(Ile)-lysidine synthase